MNRRMAHWLIFAGLGPPIGMISLLMSVAGIHGISPPISLDVFIPIVPMLGFSYVFGLLPALAAAFGVLCFQRWQIGYEWLAVSLLGVVIGLIFIIAFSGLTGSISRDGREYAEAVITCLVPTLTCRYLSGRLAKMAAPQHS